MAQSGAKRHPQKTPIFVSGRSTPIGYVAGGVFHKAISGSKHLLRSPRAIAFDRSTLTDAERAGAVWVEVADSETRTVYRASIGDVWAHGFAVHRGYGDQVALALTRWAVNGRPVATVFENNQAVKAAQPSLFGGMG